MGEFLSGLKNVLSSNVSINKIEDGIRNVIDARTMSGSKKLMRTYGLNPAKEGEMAYQRVNTTGTKADQYVVPNAQGGFGNQVSDLRRAYSLMHNKDGSWNKTAIGGVIAGSYLGVSSAARIATGGGLYRDSDGNFDLMGVPFI